nr:uncharacterized protein CI109_006002 [Kwoniella shandongensis]KAA5525694.1 hypothetical protein CI109_006002 [Kwoniella shandongensis]
MFSKFALVTLTAIIGAGVGVTAAPFTKRDTNVLLYSQKDNLCLSVETGAQANDQTQAYSNHSSPYLYEGLRVVSLPCENSSTWDVSQGNGSVYVTNSDQAFALEAGPHVDNFQTLWVNKTYPGKYSQTFFYTGDRRLAVTNSTECVDEGDNGAQEYSCTTGDTNQIWDATSPNGPLDPQPLTTFASSVSTAAATASPASASSDVTSASSGDDPSTATADATSVTAAGATASTGSSPTDNASGSSDIAAAATTSPSDTASAATASADITRLASSPSSDVAAAATASPAFTAATFALGGEPESSTAPASAASDSASASSCKRSGAN